MEPGLLTIIYLIASVTFIIGLKMLSHPESARKGNLIAAVGMGLAIIGTIFFYEDPATGERLHNYAWIFSGLAIGGVVGTVAARRIKMTAMPEMVSLFNGMGGACAALISIVEFHHFASSHFTFEIFEAFQSDVGVEEGYFELPIPTGTLVTIFLGLIIGSVSFAGSMVAWGKLNGRVKDRSFKGQHIFNIGLLIAIIGLTVALLMNISSSFVIGPEQVTNTSDKLTLKGLNIQLSASIYVIFYIILLLSLLYGTLFVLPIGGADMPVVISLLNSFTGVAAACGGFLYDNKVMLTGGILVGAAGTLLTILMCKAMNRSLKNVLIGSFGGGKSASVAAREQGNYKEIS